MEEKISKHKKNKWSCASNNDSHLERYGVAD
jgi:hypothetical protein